MLFRKKKDNTSIDIQEAIILKEYYRNTNNELIEENQLLNQQIEALTAQLAQLKEEKTQLKDEKEVALKQIQCYKREIFNLKENTSRIYSEINKAKEDAVKEHSEQLEKSDTKSHMQSKIIDYYSHKSRQLLLGENSLLEHNVIEQLFITLKDLRDVLIELITGLFNDSIKLDISRYNKDTFYAPTFRTFIKPIEDKLLEFELIFIQNGYLPYYCDALNNIYAFIKEIRESTLLNTNVLYNGKLLHFAVDTFKLEATLASTPFQKREIIHLHDMHKSLCEKGISIADYDIFEYEFYELATKEKLPLDLVTAKFFQNKIPFVLKSGVSKVNWDFKLLKRYAYKKTFYIMGCMDSKVFKYGVSINDAMSRFKEHLRIAKSNDLPNFKLLKEFKTRNAMNIEQYLNKKFAQKKWSDNPEKATHSLEWLVLDNETEVNYLLNDMWQQDEELKRILFFNPSLASKKVRYTNQPLLP